MFALWKNVISKLATGEISIFYLVSVAVETGLSLALVETLKTGFSPVVAHLMLFFFFIKLYYIQHGGCFKLRII